MDISLHILEGVLSVSALYALYKEYKEHDDAFTFNKAKDKDSIHSSLRKVEKCLDYEQKTIKWRRTLSSTLICILLIFGVIYKRFPTAKELLLHFFFIFTVFYCNWMNYASCTSSKAVRYGKQNINNIKISLSKQRSYTFPW
jgi:hypothetical protein